MGGIGLELNRLQKRPSYVAVARVFGYSLAMSVGPWLATIVAVAFVSLIGIRLNRHPDMTFFTTTVMYVFAVSLVATGPLFMIFSRYLADAAFRGAVDQRRALIFVQGLAMGGGIALGLSVAYLFAPPALGTSTIFRWSIALMVTSLIGLWCSLAYLDSQKRYAESFYTFVAGCFLSVVLAYLLRSWGQDGLVLGYALGLTAACAALLALALRRSPGLETAGDFRTADLAAYARAFASLGWLGFLYNLGTWIDKFYLWLVVGQTVSGTRFRIFQPYDISTFLSYLIMMPAISYFLVMVETAFYGDYRAYLDHLERSSLKTVDESREALWRNLKRRVNNLFELEIVVAAIGIFTGGWALRRLGLDDTTVRIFQVLIGAAFSQVLFWINLILLLYFEFRGHALLITAFFLVFNLTFTAANHTWFPDIGYGWGYFAAASLSAALSWIALRQGLRDLNRHIFFVNSSVPVKR